MKLVDGAGGEETEAATSLILGLPRPYIAIIVVLGIVSVAIVILVTVIATVCAPAETLHQFLAVIVIARYRPPGGGAGRDDMPPPMAVRRWRIVSTPLRPSCIQKSRRIYIRSRTGLQSAHLWWPAVAKLQAASVPIAQAAAPWERRTHGSRYSKMTH